MKTTALVFSGQGSQYVGMAADIIAADDRARTMAQRANDVLGYDLVEIMSQGPEDQLRQTRYTQPALFLHEAILLATTPQSALRIPRVIDHTSDVPLKRPRPTPGIVQPSSPALLQP